PGCDPSERATTAAAASRAWRRRTVLFSFVSSNRRQQKRPSAAPGGDRPAHLPRRRVARGEIFVGGVIDPDERQSVRRRNGNRRAALTFVEQRGHPPDRPSALPYRKGRADETTHHRPAEGVGAHVGGENVTGPCPFVALQFPHGRRAVAALAE